MYSTFHYPTLNENFPVKVPIFLMFCAGCIVDVIYSGSLMKFKMFKVSFWKCIIILAFVKMQHVKKNDVSSNHSTPYILKNRTFHGIVYLLSWISMKFGEKKRNAQKVMMSVIFKDVTLNIFSKNEPNSIQKKFHDFIINLRHLALTIIKLGFQLINLFVKKRISCLIEIWFTAMIFKSKSAFL